MDPRKFIMGSSQPGFSFIRPGDRVVGVIVEEPETRQMRVFKNGVPSDELAVWPDGSAKYQLVLTLQTQFRNYEGIRDPDRSVPDDGRRNVYVNGKHREAALRDAIKRIGADWIYPGDIYDETYTGDDYNSKAGIKPKLSTIVITKGQPQQAPDGYEQAQPTQNWQQPGWTAQQAHSGQAVPSHHGQPANMPDWAQAAPQSAPPAGPPAQPMSTLEALRAARESGTNGLTPYDVPEF